MKFRTVTLLAVAIIGPAAMAYALSAPNPNRPIGLPLLIFLEVIGYAFLIGTIRPRPLLGVLGAIVYFPLMFILIFQIGVASGYYDFP